MQAKDPRPENPQPEDPRPEDLRPENPRPEDLRPEGGESPRGESPRGESPRAESPRGKHPRDTLHRHIPDCTASRPFFGETRSARKWRAFRTARGCDCNKRKVIDTTCHAVFLTIYRNASAAKRMNFGKGSSWSSALDVKKC